MYNAAICETGAPAQCSNSGDLIVACFNGVVKKQWLLRASRSWSQGVARVVHAILASMLVLMGASASKADTVRHELILASNDVWVVEGDIIGAQVQVYGASDADKALVVEVNMKTSPTQKSTKYTLAEISFRRKVCQRALSSERYKNFEAEIEPTVVVKLNFYYDFYVIQFSRYSSFSGYVGSDLPVQNSGV